MLGTMHLEQIYSRMYSDIYLVRGLKTEKQISIGVQYKIGQQQYTKNRVWQRHSAVCKDLHINGLVSVILHKNAKIIKISHTILNKFCMFYSNVYLQAERTNISNIKNEFCILHSNVYLQAERTNISNNKNESTIIMCPL